LINLQYLYLDYNSPLKSIPLSLSKLTRLEHLSVFGCNNLECALLEVAISKSAYESVDVQKVLNYLRNIDEKNIKMRLIAIKSSLIGLCIDVIVLNISTFKNLAVIPLELKEKLHQHLKDNNLSIIPLN